MKMPGEWWSWARACTKMEAGMRALDDASSYAFTSVTPSTVAVRDGEHKP